MVENDVTGFVLYNGSKFLCEMTKEAAKTGTDHLWSAVWSDARIFPTVQLARDFGRKVDALPIPRFLFPAINHIVSREKLGVISL